MKVTVANEELELHPYRSAYWGRKNALILADLHLGKIAHFRKSGLFVPAIAAMDNYERLSSLLIEFEVEQVIFVGDLFHSSLNDDWRNFALFRKTFSDVAFHLVIGNHDILDHDLWLKNGVQICDKLVMEPFSFTHYREQIEGTYNLSGHVHPGVRLVGAQGHSLKLPCFFFGEEHGTLPAFGTFTGLSVLKPAQNDQVVVISEDELVRV